MALLIDFFFESVFVIGEFSGYFEYISMHLLMFIIVLLLNENNKNSNKVENHVLMFKIIFCLTFVAILLTFLIDTSMVFMGIYNIDFHIVNIYEYKYFMVIIIVLFSAFVEEYIFRKVLMNKLYEFNTQDASMKIVAILFSLIHLLGATYNNIFIFIVSFLYYYLISITLSRLLLITKSFWGIVGFHFSHNLMVLFISSYGMTSSIYPFEWSNSILRYSLGVNAGILPIWNSMTSWIVILLLINYILKYFTSEKIEI